MTLELELLLLQRAMQRARTRRMCRELLDQFFWRSIAENRLDQAEIIFHLMERLWPDPESLRRVREQRAQGATV